MSRRFFSIVGLYLLFWLQSPTLGAEAAKSSPIFTGSGLPLPPQQHAAWQRPVTKLPESLLKDVDFLFDDGMADPRNCDYRQIELVTGTCWSGDGGVIKTHGWVLPAVAGEKQQFAVAWNGLVYPAVSVGDKADLAADVKALCRGNGGRRLGATGEATAVSFESPLPLKVCLLLRLGHVDLAEQYWDVVKKLTAGGDGQAQPDDAYLALAREWCWYAFDRAACAHMWGNDVVSRDTAKLLSDAVPKVEAKAKEIGYKPPLGMDRNKTQPYIGFVGQLSALVTDETRRVKDGDVQRVLDDPKKFPDKAKRIAGLIRDLELVSARQWGQPGGVSPGDDPVPQALVKEGADAVEPLLECLEHDDRLTRSVSFGRDFFEGRNLVPVKSSAYAVLQSIMQTETFGTASDEINRGGGGDSKAIVAEIREFWAKSKGKSIAERWFETLADDKAGPARWVEAAGHMVEAADVERHGQWISEPNRKSGEIPAMKGEALRAKKHPSVADLMAKRVPAVAAENNGWLFAQSSAADLALDFHKWDAPAAIPVLREQLQRCMDASKSDGKGINPDPGWAQSTQTTEQMARDAGRLTVALADSKDAAGTKMYRTWVVTQNPAMPGSNVGEMLRPIWRFPDDTNLAAAADELFNGANSTWRCLPTTVQFRDWGPTTLMASPIYSVPAFGKHLARNLDDLTIIGSAQVKDHTLDVELKAADGTGYGGVNIADPLLPKPADTKVPIRVCDWYAWEISKLDGAPAFELYWPVAKRDEQRKRMMPFLDHWRERLRYTPLQVTLDFGFPDADPCRMTFPKLDHPATEADVAAGKAIFSLSGGPVRVVALPNWPAKAKWITNKDYPIQQQGETDSKTGVTKYIDDFNNQGIVWQAEEVQVDGKWKRYYGFVGAHAVAKVAAEDIEFVKEP